MVTNFHRYLEQRIARAAATSVDEHAAELARLNGLRAACDVDKAAMVGRLFTDFDIDDVDLAAFTAELEEEFLLAVAAGMIANPTMIVPNLPAIPTGSEPSVASARADIQAAAEKLGKCMDFNEKFAAGFVCDRATAEIMGAIAAADAELGLDKAAKQSDLAALFLLEGTPG